jgi:hypothetical protein
MLYLHSAKHRTITPLSLGYCFHVSFCCCSCFENIVCDFNVAIPKDCLHATVIVKSLEYLFVILIEGVSYLTVFNGA